MELIFPLEYVVTFVIFIACILVWAIYWYKTEKAKEFKKVIIPQYEPPKKFGPAVAQIIVYERFSSRALVATIVDLAIRGYVTIEESYEDIIKTYNGHLWGTFLFFLATIPFTLLGFMLILWLSLYYEEAFILAISLPFIVIIFILIFHKRKEIKMNHGYIIRKKNFSIEDGEKLKGYEKEFLNLIFRKRDFFDTKDFGGWGVEEFFKEFKKIEDDVFEEVEAETEGFEIGMLEEKKGKMLWKMALFGFIFLLLGINEYKIPVFEYRIGVLCFLFAVIIFSLWGLWVFIKYDARLSEKGRDIKRDLLGFKMYLEVVETSRVQNLKVEDFQKYLPYAMIFGLERKWASFFSSSVVEYPEWYIGKGSNGRFSVSDFSGNLSLSLLEVFAAEKISFKK